MVVLAMREIAECDFRVFVRSNRLRIAQTFGKCDVIGFVESVYARARVFGDRFVTRQNSKIDRVEHLISRYLDDLQDSRVMIIFVFFYRHVGSYIDAVNINVR